MKLMADIVEFDGTTLTNYKPLTDHFVVEIPDVELKTAGGLHKSEKQIAEEMEKVLGEYFRVVAVGPKCESIKVGDDIFMIPPRQVMSFKAKFGEKFKRFAIFKEYLVLGKIE